MLAGAHSRDTAYRLPVVCRIFLYTIFTSKSPTAKNDALAQAVRNRTQIAADADKHRC